MSMTLSQVYRLRPALAEMPYGSIRIDANEIFKTNPMVFRTITRSSVYGGEAEYSPHASPEPFWPCDDARGFAHFNGYYASGSGNPYNWQGCPIETERELIVPAGMSGPRGAVRLPQEFRYEHLDATHWLYLIGEDWIPYTGYSTPNPSDPDHITTECDQNATNYGEMNMVVPVNEDIISWSNQPAMLDTYPHIKLHYECDATTFGGQSESMGASVIVRFRPPGGKWYGIGLRSASTTAAWDARTGAWPPYPVSYFTDSTSLETSISSLMVRR